MHDGTVPLWRSALVEWPMKLCFGVLLGLVYSGGYLLIERHLWRPPVQFNALAVDRWAGFSPGWIWAYQSIYLMLPLGLLATTRDELRRFGIGFGWIMLVGFGCFVLFPVRGPRVLSAPITGMYGIVVRYDRPFNNFPSLHMAVATYFSCVAVQLTRGPLRRVLLFVLPAWVVLIGYSTLATKQHYAVDLPPGVLLGWVAQRIAWRQPQSNRNRERTPL